MPRKKNKTTELEMGPLKEEFLSQAGALWDEFEERMVDVIDRAEKSKLGVGFHTTIDDSQQNVKITTRIAFGENYGDEKVSQLDPDQEKFAEVLAEAKSKKSSKKPSESVDADE